MSPRRFSRLAVQSLERRDTPATFGETWLDHRHVTLSFAPDGADILGSPSSLGSVLGPLNATNAKHHILKAFQTWASKTNLNVGVVNDDGTAFDRAGAQQRDPRFGDIRIGARPLAGDVVAIASPSGWWTSYAGDILLNSTKTFSLNGAGINTYDLFTVVLQEAGHAFGLSNSPDTSSAMYTQYGRSIADVTAGDVANIRALYGARQNDGYEGTTGNDTLGTAAALTGGPIEADLSAASETDWYRFESPTGAATTVRLKAAGLSLLTPRVEVYDAAGTLLASAATVDPLSNDVVVTVPESLPGAVFYVKVSAARSDVFGVGAYRLAVDALGGFQDTDPYALVDTETGANDTAASAVTLTPVQTPVTRPTTSQTRSSLAAAGDVDYFRIQAPAAGAELANLAVTVTGVGVNGLAPTVEVFNAAGELVNAKVSSTSANHLVLTVRNADPGADYLIRVGSDTGAVANYDLSAAFRAAVPKHNGSYGLLGPAAASTAATFNVYQSQALYFALGTTGDASTAVRVSVYDSQNQLVFQMTAAGGQTEVGFVFLRRGAYRVEVAGVGLGLLGSIAYDFRMYGLTDSELASPTDPSGGSGSGDVLPDPPTTGETTTITRPVNLPPDIFWL